MVYEKQGRTVAVLYDSITEPGTATLEREHNRKERAASMERGDDDGSVGPENWFGAPSRAEFEARLRGGWGEGADKLRELATKEIHPASIRRRRVKADQGDEVDMQAVWRGDLGRAWTRTRRQTRTGTRSVSIVCNLACSWTQKAADLFWRGASALKLAEELSLAGYSVAIYAATATRSVDQRNRLDAAQFVEVKAEDQPLDVSALATIVAMPGFKRTRFHGGTSEIADREGLNVHDALGYPHHELVKTAVAMLPMPQRAYVQPEINSREAAEKWIDKVLDSIENPEIEAA